MKSATELGAFQCQIARRIWRLFVLSAVLVLTVSAAAEPFKIQSETAAKKASISARFAADFSREFDDRDAALKAWTIYGGHVLLAVENELYPAVDYRDFRRRALARIRVARAADPRLSPAQLSVVALDGVRNGPDDLPRDDAAAFSVFDHDGADYGVSFAEILEEEDDPSAFGLKGLAKNAPKYDLAGLARETGLGVYPIGALDKKAASPEFREFLRENDEPFILDLRGNYGGLIESALDIAAHFVTEETPVFRIARKEDRFDELKVLALRPKYYGDPFLILIDKETNAGALALAIMLREFGVANIAGERADWIKDSIETVRFLTPCPPPGRGCILRVPTHILITAKGERLADALVVDFPVDPADGDAAIKIVKDWRSGVENRKQ